MNTDSQQHPDEAYAHPGGPGPGFSLDVDSATALRSQGFRRAPLIVERPIDDPELTPVHALRVLRQRSDRTFLLESAARIESSGRYTFLGADPELEISAHGDTLTVTEAGRSTHLRTDRPLAHIARLLDERRCPRVPGLPPFVGGLVGHFAFDSLRYAEPVLRPGPPNPEGFADIDLMLFERTVIIDHESGHIMALVQVPLDDAQALPERIRRAREQATRMLDGLESGTPSQESGQLLEPLSARFSREEYADIVQRARRHIHEGDIFQVVLANRLEAPYEGTLLKAYEHMRALNPSPYMFAITSADAEIIGASPETLLRLRGRRMESFPLAGSRPRGATTKEDNDLERELRNDPKELAEHDMLVDLGRNDLGRVSSFGTVRLARHLEVLRFSHIMHLGSTVTGELREGLTGLDALSAVLPAGTLSGAPKVRAVQIIDELEGVRRGVYGGSIGYLSLNGDLDMCIAIRIAARHRGRVYVESGAGIVADSIPEREYQECANKAKAVTLSLDDATESARSSDGQSADRQSTGNEGMQR